MKKAFGIYLISLLFIASGCMSKGHKHECCCESKAAATAQDAGKKDCCASDHAGHNHAGHDHKDCKDGSCDMEKKKAN